ncbi:MAG: histone deacetylase, partial [Acidimicrobiales bacterium]
PVEQMQLDADDFAQMTDRVVGAGGGRHKVILFLEGGYDLSALRDSVAACAGRLARASHAPDLG